MPRAARLVEICLVWRGQQVGGVCCRHAVARGTFVPPHLAPRQINECFVAQLCGTLSLSIFPCLVLPVESTLLSILSVKVLTLK